MARTGGAPQPTITPDSALGGSVIERSLRFNRTDAPYLQATLGNGDEDKWTWSGWVKKTVNGQHQNLFSSGSDVVYTHINFDNNDRIRFQNWHSAQKGTKITTRKIRDHSSWMHIVVIWDSGNSTADDRMRIYVNGTRETSFSSSTNPDQNQDSVINGNSLGGSDYGEGKHFIGKFADTSDNSGTYKTEIHFIDGYAYDPSYFGYTEFQTGIWRPKRYEGSYGTNGFHLDFSDNSSTTTLGIDKSPNGNDFTLNNFSVSAGIDNDSFTDTPTSKNVFAQLNSNLPLASGASYRNGNYAFHMTNNGAHMRASSDMSVNSGKWYAEFKLSSYTFASGSYPYIGVCAEDLWLNSWVGDAGTAYQTGGTIWRNGSSISSGHGTYAAGDIISIAMDLDQATPKVWWAKNGTYINSGNPATNTNGTDIAPTSNTGYYTYALSLWAATGGQWDANFGQRAFSYDIPSGFKTLCTDNIRSTQSIIPKKHFDTVLYAGNNASGRKITGLGFKPDLVWFKKRDNGSQNHTLYDSVRGAGKRLMLPSNSQEDTVSDELTSFADGGFVIDTDNFQNENGSNYVAWCWKAGGTAVSNSDGSITTSISANQEAGFSIVTWTGTGSNSTVGHGLGKAPKVVICKLRDTTTQDWFFMPGEITGERGKYIKFNTTDGVASDIHTFPPTAPTSTVFTVGGEDGGNSSNGNGSKYVAYCWAEIPGYSKFGQYKGNGSADGPYVHLGFRPALLITRRIDSGDNWIIKDSARNTFNDVFSNLNPNTSNTEFGSAGDVNSFDFVSNGFKIRGSNSAVNASGGTFIYMAFAEQTALTAFDQANPNAR